ncbi:N-acetylneuraminate lyase B-like [Watersipora subatra]|uniref:N-acetylneuraminate lyase B-like n=1 Tax=Watersipora subatra TaxID=2589382 RepID=UPI00355BB792
MAKVCDTLVLDDDCIMAAPATPFLTNGDLNLAGFEAYANQMTSTGIDSLFVNGTLGEGMSMTVAERKAALEQWMKVKEGRFKTIIAHCGSGSVRDAIDLAKHAASVKVDAVAVMCPMLFKPSNIPTLVNYLKVVADQIPETPFFYYDINVLTGVIFDTGEVMRQCKAAIGSFSGIKYSCREMGNYEAGMMESENGRYKIAVGAVDEEFLPWLALGAKVTIGQSLMGTTHRATRTAFLAGDMAAARESQRFAQKVGIIKRKYGNDIAVSKALVRMKGVEVGPVRPPLVDLTPEAYDSLQKELKEINFL